jgi:transcriptional regulator with XRE-family HTH domain
MTSGPQLRALRERLSIDLDTLARELGTSPTTISIVERRKSVTAATYTRCAVAAFTIAKRDLDKHRALRRELAATGRRLQQAAYKLKP